MGQGGAGLYPDSYIVGVERYPCHFCPQEQTVYDEYHYANYLEWEPTVKFSTVIGNPPYSLAQEFVDKSLDILSDRGRVLFLLRLAFLESQKRNPWWKEVPLKKVWVLSNRPSFTGNGKTDDTAYALYLWEKGFDGIAQLSWLLWED